MAKEKKQKKEKQPKNKNKNSMMVVIILLVILLLSIGIGFFLIFKNLNTPIETVDVTNQVSTAPKDIQLITLESPIYTNLLTGEDNKEHVIRLNVSIGVDYTEPKVSDPLIAQINERMVIVQDIIVGVARNKTFQELRVSDAQEILKSEILVKLREEFQSNLIYRVIINEILLQ